MKPNCSTKNYGFTLVELLVVISIISILAGALFMVINPAQLQRKAREAVMKAKTSQICLALNSCGAAQNDATKCSTFELLGVMDPSGDPVGSTYSIVSKSDPIVSDSTIYIDGLYTVTGCQHRCSFSFIDGTIGNFQQLGTNCL